MDLLIVEVQLALVRLDMIQIEKLIPRMWQSGYHFM